MVDYKYLVLKEEYTSEDGIPVRVFGFKDSKLTNDMLIYELRDELDMESKQEGAFERRYEFSLKGVEFISSSALECFMNFNRRLNDGIVGGDYLGFRDVSKEIFELFALTRLNRLWDVYLA